ncbi:MAG: hypothetical protein K2I80_11740, partial [Ruminococcus sp.]|nr:hypothetical protein [Ruminococcus sp.]
MDGNKNLKIIAKIENTFKNNGYSTNVALVVKNLFNYMIRKDLHGCCHSFSSVLYVALSEINLNPKLLIGECRIHSMPPFDHSWIVLNDKIIDIAIYLPLDNSYKCVEGPIILDKDVVTNKRHHIEYGINTGLPWSPQTDRTIHTCFSEYMSKCPWEVDGLWTVLQMILPETITIDVTQ